MIIGTRVDLVCTFNLWLFIPKLLQSVKIAVYENEWRTIFFYFVCDFRSVSFYSLVSYHICTRTSMLERKYSSNLDNWYEIITSMRPVYRNNKHFRIYQQLIQDCLYVTKENRLLLVKQIQIQIYRSVLSLAAGRSRSRC